MTHNPAGAGLVKLRRLAATIPMLHRGPRNGSSFLGSCKGDHGGRAALQLEISMDSAFILIAALAIVPAAAFIPTASFVKSIGLRCLNLQHAIRAGRSPESRFTLRMGEVNTFRALNKWNEIMFLFRTPT